MRCSTPATVAFDVGAMGVTLVYLLAGETLFLVIRAMQSHSQSEELRLYALVCDHKVWEPPAYSHGFKFSEP